MNDEKCQKTSSWIFLDTQDNLFFCAALVSHSAEEHLSHHHHHHHHVRLLKVFIRNQTQKHIVECISSRRWS